MKNQNMIVACTVTAVVAGSIGFFGNNLYQQSQRNSRFPQMENRTGNGQNNFGTNRQVNGSIQPGMMGRGGALNGEVTAKDNKTLTIKLSDGSSKIVILSDNTTYRTSTETTQDKVEIGTKIAAFGTTSTDGTTVATSIEVNPISLRK